MSAHPARCVIDWTARSPAFGAAVGLAMAVPRRRVAAAARRWAAQVALQQDYVSAVEDEPRH